MYVGSSTPEKGKNVSGTLLSYGHMSPMGAVLAADTFDGDTLQ